MTQAAKAQEPSMEEILASIRRIIADDDAAKTPEPAKPAPAAAAPKAAASAPAAPAPRPAAPPPRAAAPPAPPPASNSQDDIDAMFATAEPEPQQNGAAPEADILELTEAMEAQPAPALRRIDAMPDVVEAPPAPRASPRVEPAAETPTVEEARRQFQESTESDRHLLSPVTTAAVDSAFNSLAQTVLVQNSRTLDDLVREMLRPMLKAWLDDNLPNLVERLVRAEIERVARGRR
jgi:cell pole-organizing protein PopZ